MLHTEKSNVRSEQTIYLAILVREDSQNEHGAVVGQKMEHSSHTLIRWKELVLLWLLFNSFWI